MGFLSYLDQGIVSNTATYDSSKYIILSHPNTAHGLILSEFGQSGYSSTLGGYKNSNGETILGNLIINGGYRKPAERWEVSECVINQNQEKLFDLLLGLQHATKIPISLTDCFTKYQYVPTIKNLPTWYGTPVNNVLGYLEGFTSWNVFIDVDEQYLSILPSNRLNLQFSAKQL
jgi:hypothetical protein